MRFPFLALALAAPSILAACSGASPPDPFGQTSSALTSAVPKRAWLRLDLDAVQSTSSNVGSAAAAIKADLPAPQACTGGPPAMFAAMSMDIASHANGLLDGIMSVIETVTSQPPTMADPDTAVWGPITSAPSPAVYRVVVHRVAPDASHFELDGTPKGGDGSTWLGVMQGIIQTSDPAHQQGNLIVDFGAAHTLDPSSDPVAGGVAIGFANAPEGHAVDEAFSNVVGRNAPQPNDAHYHLSANPETLTFQWVTRTDFDHDGISDELLNVQAQWFAQGPGKAVIVVTGGDLGNAQVAAAECWNPQQQTVFYVDDIHANPPAGDPACCPPVAF